MLNQQEIIKEPGCATRPLRIGWFTNGFPVSSEPFIALQAAELVARGHDLRIFGLSNLPASPPSSSARVNRLLEGRFTNAEWPRNRLRKALAVPGAAVRTADKVGVSNLPILRPLTFRRTWLDLSSTFQGELVAGQEPFDILHCQFATLGEHVVKLLDAGLLTGRLIVHFRGYDITEVVRALGADVYKHLWTRADGFIANCAHFRDLAIEIGCPPDRISIVGSGIELESFDYREPLPASRAPIRLLAVGRLITRKGFHTLIRALALLESDQYDCELKIIGDGEERERLEALASECGIASKVEFTGALPHSQIAHRLSESHIFVAPSETSAQGGADAPTNTIKEAMAIGVPVCATRHGGIPELVEEGVTGVLANEADPIDLAAAIKRLIDSAPSWPRMTKAARTRVEDQYATHRVTDKLLAVYEQALARPN